MPRPLSLEGEVLGLVWVGEREVGCVFFVACVPNGGRHYRRPHPCVCWCMQSVNGVVILASLAITVSVGALANVPFDELPRPSWQPRDVAFAVWAVIYAAIAVGGTLQLVPTVGDRIGLQGPAFLAASLACCTAWLLAAVRRRTALSAALLLAAFALAMLALVAAPSPRNPCSVAGWAAATGPALLSGWLAVAAALGLNMAWQSRRGHELPAWTALPLALAAAAAGVYSGTPEVGAVLVWAAFFGARSAVSALLGLTGVVAGIVALIRSALYRQC